MSTPGTLVILAVTIFPLLYALYFSFTNYQLGFAGQVRFVGLVNYLKALGDGRFWSDLLNTGLLVVGGVAAQLTLGMLIALILNAIRHGRAFALSLMLIPVVISPIVAGWQGRMLLNDQYGPLNAILRSIGLNPPSWLADPHVSLLSIFLIDTWQWTPFMALILLAALQGISSELLDAAQVDGASGSTIFWKIILPIITPTLMVAVLIRAVDAFKTFDLVYLLTSGGPGSSSETISFLTYLQGFQFFNVAYAAAMAFIQLFIVSVLASQFIKYMQRGQP